MNVIVIRISKPSANISRFFLILSLTFFNIQKIIEVHINSLGIDKYQKNPLKLGVFNTFFILKCLISYNFSL